MSSNRARKRGLTVNLTAGLLVLSATIAPVTSAQADDVVPYFTAAGSVAGHPELLRAKFSTGTPVTSVKVKLASIDGTLHAVTLAFDQDAGEWRSARLNLPLGSYSATFLAADAEGDTASRDYRLDYRLRPVVVSQTIATDPLDYDHRTLRAKGRIALYDPRTQGYADEVRGGFVYLYASMASTQSYSTGAAARPAADGTYTVEAVPETFLDGSPLGVEVFWQSDSSDVSSYLLLTNDWTIGEASVPAKADLARFVMDETTITNSYPKLSTISGVLQHQVDGVWVPAAGVGVHLAQERVHVGGADALTTSTGRFTIKAGFDASTTAKVFVQGPAHAFLNRSSSEVYGSVKIVLRYATVLDWTRPKVDAFREVPLYGHIDAQPWKKQWSGKVRIYLQRSLDGKTSWTSVGSLVTTSDGWFQGNVTTPRTSGYFRVRYKGSTSRQPSSGKVFTLSRKDTRIAKAKITPTTIAKGRKITISGVVQRYTGTKFVNLSKSVMVDIMFRTKSQKGVDAYYGVRTDSSGRFTIKVEPWQSGYWSARWLTNSSTLVHAIGPETYVKVT